MTFDIFFKVSQIPLFYGLSYIAGRMYKQWYYDKFNINFEELKFPHNEYLISSWTTWLSTFSTFCILWSLIKGFSSSSNTFSMILSFLPIVTSVYVFYFWPIKFNPKASIILKIFGSKDVVYWIIGLLTFLLLLQYQYYKTLDFTRKENIIWYLADVFLRFISDLKGLLIFTFIAFISILFISFLQALYQAKSAVNEGKMGFRNTIYNNTEYHVIFINDKIYLFNPKNDTSIFLKDKEMIEIMPYRKIRDKLGKNTK
jgi:hypothetical protein